MKSFMLKSILLTGLVFFGVLVGLQIASQGIQKTRGMNDQRFKSAVQIKQNKTGNVQATLLGKNITETDLLAKQQKLEKMKSFNPISALGSLLSNGVDTAVNTVVHKIFGQ